MATGLSGYISEILIVCFLVHEIHVLHQNLLNKDAFHVFHVRFSQRAFSISKSTDLPLAPVPYNISDFSRFKDLFLTNR